MSHSPMWLALPTWIASSENTSKRPIPRATPSVLRSYGAAHKWALTFGPTSRTEQIMSALQQEAILATIDHQEPVELAQQLIRIPSFLWRESEVGFWIAEWMRARGFEVEVQEVPLRNGGVTHQAIGRLKGDGSGPSLMLCGHTDTSDWNGDVFRRGEWTHDPFGAEIVDGTLYGLG